MIETILRELQREGIEALNWEDKFLAMADAADTEEEAARRRRDAHAEHDIAASLAWVYSRTIEGACTADIINLWNRIRKADKEADIRRQEMKEMNGHKKIKVTVPNLKHWLELAEKLDKQVEAINETLNEIHSLPLTVELKEEEE